MVIERNGVRLVYRYTYCVYFSKKVCIYRRIGTVSIGTKYVYRAKLPTILIETFDLMTDHILGLINQLFKEPIFIYLPIKYLITRSSMSQ